MDIAEFTDKEFAAYLAAFTDGEGNIGFERPDKVHRHQFFVRITLANCVPEVLRDIQSRLGYGSIHSQKQRENWRERFVFVVSNLADCERFLLTVHPYLQIKLAEANIALERDR
ncbi:MAG: hypothetical protein M0Z43_13490, partial [Acidithiobacillus sp.]|nr:hypothetical protein [Acidithiobacillus sp.]